MPNGVDERFSPVGRPGAGAPRATGSIGPTCSSSARASRARTSPRWPTRTASCASWASSWWRRARGAPTCARARRRRCARSATCGRATCPASTPARWRSPCRRCTRASGCPCSRRWPAACRWWRPTARRCPRPAATPRCSWIPRTAPALADALRRRRHRRGAARAARAGRARAGDAASPGRAARELTDEVIGEVLEQDEPIAPRPAPRPRRRRPPSDRGGRVHDHRQPRAPRPARDRASSSLERRAARESTSDTELIVVDNGSTRRLGGARARAASRTSTLVALPRNQGFAGGLAAGIAAAGGEWIAVFNNDTTVEPDAVAVMLEAARRDPRVGSVAAQMRFADRRDVLNSAGLELDRLGHRGRPAGRHARRATTASDSPTRSSAPPAAPPSSARDMLEQVGGFDETFFAFFEDVDLAWRAQAHGWTRPVRARGGRLPPPLGHRAPRLAGEALPRGPQPRAHAGQERHHRDAAAQRARDAALRRWPTWSSRRSPRAALAPLRGRLQGLREWRGYRRAGTPHRRPVDCAGRSASGGALQRHRAWARSLDGASRAEHSRRAGAPLTMRSAIVHDWFQGFHGAERTVAAMLDLFARDPDIFTFHAARELLPDRLAVGDRAASRGSSRLPGRPPARPRPGPLALAAALHAALLRAPRPERLRARGQLLARLRGGREAARARRCTSATATRRCATSGCRRRSAAGRAASRALALRALRGRLRALGPARVRSGPTSTSPTRRPWPSGSRASTAARRWWCRRRWPSATFPRDVARDPSHFLWVHRLVPYKRPLEVAEAFRGAARPAADDGRRRAARGASCGPACRPTSSCSAGSPRERLARALRQRRRASSTSARRTSASRWSRRSPPARRCSRADRGGARDIVRPGRDGVLISDGGDPAQIRAGVRELAGARLGRRGAAQSAQRFSEERFGAASPRSCALSAQVRLKA